MASKTLLELTQEAPSASDLLYFVKNPGGTPLDRSASFSQLASLLTPIAQNQIAYATAANTLGGNAVFRADPSGMSAYGISFIENETYIAGVGVDLQFSPYGNNVNAFTGQKLIIYTGDADPSSYTGIDLQIDNSIANAATGVVGISSQIYNDDGGNNVGLNIYIEGANSQSNIGINVDNISGGTNNYAIKTGTGPVDFGSEVRAGGDVSGAVSRTTLTNATNATTTNAYVVAGGQAATTENTGWIKIYVGTTPAWVPYWANATP